MNKVIEETKNSICTSAYALACALLIACGGKEKEAPAAAQNLEKGSPAEEAPPASAHIQIVPTMRSAFSDSNTAHCANIEYLWDKMMRESDKDISSNAMAREFKKSRSWKNSMDISRLVLAFGKPEEVYESIVDQYQAKYQMGSDDLSPEGDTFWGYTDKVVQYKYAEPFDEQRLLFLGTEVSAFGFNSEFGSMYVKEYFRQQYDILYFGGDGSL